MTAEELLLDLQDIQPPPDPAWWLLPPLVWVVFGLLSGLVLLGLWYRRRRDRKRPGSDALAALEQIAARHQVQRDDVVLVRNLALWLKQVALQAYPGQGLESLCGRRWLEFLDQSLGDDDFSRGAGAVFGDAVYRRDPQIDAAAALDLCRSWFERVQPRLLRGAI